MSFSSLPTPWAIAANLWNCFIQIIGNSRGHQAKNWNRPPKTVQFADAIKLPTGEREKQQTEQTQRRQTQKENDEVAHV